MASFCVDLAIKPSWVVKVGAFVIDPQQVQDVKRALGAKLARWRKSRGLTQADVAERVYSTRSTIAGVECGQQVADRIFWQRCETFLDAGGELLAGYDGYRSLKQRHDQEKLEARQRARWGEVEGDSRPGMDGVPTVAGRALLPPAQVVRSSTSAGGPVETGWPADRSTGLGWPGLGQVSVDVDPALALHWSEMLRLLAASHNVFGSRQVYDAVCRELAVIRRYRHEAMDDLKSRLLAVEARWAEFGSWTADNLGDAAAAAYWLDQALELARGAGDRRMAAYVFMRQAQQAADRLDGTHATRLARTAETIVSLADRDRALCLIRQAQGHALLGDQPRSLTALKIAHKLIDRAASVGADDSDTIGRHCTLAYLRAHEGYCLLRLGQAKAAARALEEVLDGWPVEYRQDETLARAWLALSYVSVDRLAEAGVEGSRALSLAAATSSARAMRTLGQLHAQLTGKTASAEVVGFRNAFSLVASTARL
ncbi:helix-turn-helix domain-containing protein [Micromonospora echinospora]|uniref:helix-turn-helix domain-containing protein n=1 Tax=Micromonospora echinospora TaxID=1877 RepID=UPI001E3BBDF6|nr:helix-turn-helix domain-containing protein [Micromonospora echinospora]